MIGFTHLPIELQLVIREYAQVALSALDMLHCECPKPRIVIALSLDTEGKITEDGCAGLQKFVFMKAEFQPEIIESYALQFAAIGYAFTHEDDCPTPIIVAAPLN